MPELPEVETVRRGLEPILVGNRFAAIAQRRADLRFPLPQRFAERLVGRTVEALDRRAKYLLARLDDGEVLVMHLGMTGRFTIDCANGAAIKTQRRIPKHEHIVFHLADGTLIRYTDVRRFGLMDLIRADMVKPGAVVIDVGVNRVDDDTRERGYRLTGDVAFDEVREVASAISPVPGGVGPMTIAMLLSNTVDAAVRSAVAEG